MASTSPVASAVSLPAPTTPLYNEPSQGRALPPRPLPTTPTATPDQAARPASSPAPGEDDITVLYEDVNIRVLHEVVNLVDDLPIVYELIHLE